MFNRYAHIKKIIFGDYYKYCKSYSSLMDLCIFQCSLYLLRGLISPLVYKYIVLITCSAKIYYPKLKFQFPTFKQNLLTNL